jgi:hypothetical protein
MLSADGSLIRVQGVEQLVKLATTAEPPSPHVLLPAVDLACLLALCSHRWLQHQGAAMWSALWRRVAASDEHALSVLASTRDLAGVMSDDDRCAPVPRFLAAVVLIETLCWCAIRIMFARGLPAYHVWLPSPTHAMLSNARSSFGNQRYTLPVCYLL